jgi:hypothetical protein
LLPNNLNRVLVFPQTEKHGLARLRIAFAQFLSAESPGLMAITNLGEFKFTAIEAFRGILHRTVKAAIGNNSPIPPWAANKVSQAWNVPDL